MIDRDTKILIVGGAGFIGSAIARRLLEKGYHNVFVFDNLSTAVRESIPEGCVFIQGDIRRKDDFCLLPNNINYVFHLAAATSVEESFAKPEFYLENNIYGTMNLLEWSLKSRVKKFTYASSGAIYGNVAESVVMREDLLPNPNNYYGLTKLDGEYLVNMYNLNFGLDFVILRYFNVFGEGQDCISPYASVIPKFIYAAINNRDITVYGSGEQTRDFIHVEEAVEATLIAAEKGRGIYNVATGEQTDVNTIARLILKYIKSDSKIIHLPPLPGDSMRDNGSNKRLLDLGWSRKKKIDDWLRQTIEWYKCNVHTKSTH